MTGEDVREAYRDWLESQATVSSGHVGRALAFQAGYEAGREAGLREVEQRRLGASR